MRPHSQNTDDTFLVEYFIHQSMLDIDSARIGAREITDQLLVWRRLLQRVSLQYSDQCLHFGFETGRSNLFCILERCICVDDLPSYHSSSLVLVSRGSAIPFLMESRMPGMEARYRVSWIASQSSSDISTALERLPAIRIGW